VKKLKSEKTESSITERLPYLCTLKSMGQMKDEAVMTRDSDA
jgi:hypothetical protein